VSWLGDFLWQGVGWGGAAFDGAASGIYRGLLAGAVRAYEKVLNVIRRVVCFARVNSTNVDLIIRQL
jgi:hypothetical protein